MKLYHLFVRAILHREGLKGKVPNATRKAVLKKYENVYERFKHLITRRYSLNQLSYLLRKFDYSKPAKTKTSRLFKRYLTRAIKEVADEEEPPLPSPPPQKSKQNDFLYAFLNELDFIDSKMYDFLEGFTFVENEERETIWSNFSSMLKALIEYIALSIKVEGHSAEDYSLVTVRGDVPFSLFKTFTGESHRTTRSSNLMEVIKILLTTNLYNPAILIEVVKEDEVFKFDYLYGRDDEDERKLEREPDYSIYINAKF